MNLSIAFHQAVVCCLPSKKNLQKVALPTIFISILTLLYMCFAPSVVAGTSNWPDNGWPNEGIEDGTSSIRVGDFLFAPYVGFGLQRTDNYLKESDENANAVLDESLSIFTLGSVVNSDWPRHAFNVSFDFEQGIYQDNTADDFSEAQLNVYGRADVTRPLSLFAGLELETSYVPRSDDNVQSGVSGPDVYTASTQLFGANFLAAGNLKFTTSYKDKTYSFEPNTLLNGTSVTHAARDRTRSHLKAHAHFKTSPVNEVLLGMSLQSIDYEQTSSQGRNANGQGLEIGTRLILPNVATGDVRMVFESWDFKDSSYQDTTLLGFAINLDYKMGERIRIQLETDKTLEDTILSGASSRIQSDYDLTLSWRLTRNVTLSALFGASYTSYVYDTSGTTQNDYNDLLLGLRSTYDFTDNVRLFTLFETENREATSAENSYTETVMTIGGLLRY